MSKVEKLSIGVDLGGTKIAAGLCSGKKILEKCVLPTDPDRGAKAVILTIAEACKNLIKNCKKEVVGIGVGAAGQIDPSSGAVIYAPNLKWNKVPLGKTLSNLLSLPVKVTNDVRAATLAEWHYGAGKGLENFVNIFLGTGIGSGFVLNGRLLSGKTNSAGEIGHICLDPEGPICGCGKKGCFEAFASGRGLENYVKDMLRKGEKSLISELVQDKIDSVTGKVIGEAARQKDRLALEALDRVGYYLGLACANLHTMLNPEKIILGGGLMALSEFFMPKMEETVDLYILPVANRKGLFTRAKFETEAAIIGSAALFL